MIDADCKHILDVVSFRENLEILPPTGSSLATLEK